MLALSHGLIQPSHAYLADGDEKSAPVLLRMNASMLAAVFERPDDGIIDRYEQGLRLVADENDFDGALAEIDDAISTYDAGRTSDDPLVAALYLMRAALLYSARGDRAEDDILDALGRVAELNYFADFPPQMRSERLSELLEQARGEHGQMPSQAMVHTTPETDCGADLHFRVLTLVPENGSVALYWRRAGRDSEYEAVEMRTFFNVADVRVESMMHADADLEYFLLSYDGEQRPVANLGSLDSPMRLDFQCGNDDSAPFESNGKVEKEEKERKREPSDRKIEFVTGLAVGSGFGLAQGQADLLYERIDPNQRNLYTSRVAACAIARRAAGGGELPSATELYGSDPTSPSSSSIFGRVAVDEGQARSLALAYDRDVCELHHPVLTGMAPAYLHLAPEFGLKFESGFETTVFARLQVMTGSRVYGPTDGGSDVTEARPATGRLRAPFPWAIGARVKYLLTKKPTAKLKANIGVFAGYGRAALAVPMPFGQDRNGNSVTDAFEITCADGTNQPVFPYMDGCDEGADTDVAKSVRESSVGQENAVDTVSIGRLFAGASVGAEYFITPMLGLGAEAMIGAWFAGRTSFLIDLNIGPRLHF